LGIGLVPQSISSLEARVHPFAGNAANSAERPLNLRFISIERWRNISCCVFSMAPCNFRISGCKGVVRTEEDVDSKGEVFLA
jgi:hypothetical protein